MAFRTAVRTRLTHYDLGCKMARHVANTAISAVVITAFNLVATVAFGLAIPHQHVTWLIKPILGLDITRIPPEQWGFGQSIDAAISVGMAALLLVVLSFYLMHCVIYQRTWASLLGWGLASAGFITDLVERLIGSSAGLAIDINRWLWPLGIVEAAVGCYFVLMSVWIAPEMVVPASRKGLLILIGVVAAIGFVGGYRNGYLVLAWALLALVGYGVLTALLLTRQQSPSEPNGRPPILTYLNR